MGLQAGLAKDEHNPTLVLNHDDLLGYSEPCLKLSVYRYKWQSLCGAVLVCMAVLPRDGKGERYCS